jgi:hypothetical protein
MAPAIFGGAEVHSVLAPSCGSTDAADAGRAGRLGRFQGLDSTMSRSVKKSGTNTIVLLILLVGFLLVAYYATVAMTSGDLLWFLRGFRDRPSRMIVYRIGQRTELRPRDPAFEELAAAVKTSLAEGFARLSNVGFSEQTLQDAYTQYVTLEVFWDQPVELHAWFPTGRTTQLLFPITGRHAEMSIVLLGDAGHYRAGAPVLNTIEPIRESLQSLGPD